MGIMENAVELEHIPTNSEWRSGGTQVHSLIPTIIIDDVDDDSEKEMEIAIDIKNHDQEQPTNLVIGEDEDLKLVIDEDFSSDVIVKDDQIDIIDDEEVNERNDICLHIPLKKRGKFSCINCSLQRA